MGLGKLKAHPKYRFWASQEMEDLFFGNFLILGGVT